MNRSTTTRILTSLASTAAATVVAAASLLTATPAQAASTGPDHVAPGLERKAEADGLVPVIVQLDVVTSATVVTKGSEQAAIVHARKDLLDALGHRPAAFKTDKQMSIVAFHATPADLAVLDDSSSVAAVTEDVELEAMGVSDNGSATGQQLPAQWDYSRIKANTAKNNGYTGKGQVIAVIDTGVDRYNPYLQGKVAYEACYSTTSPGTGSSVGQCPNGTNVQYGTGASKPCGYSYYGCGHGTHVAHTAAGAYGVARGASIAAVNAAHRATDRYGNPAPSFYLSDLTWALKYVYDLRTTHGVKVAAVNLSLGGGLFTGYCDGGWSDGTAAPLLVGQWLDAVRGAGIAPVISSGNDSSASALGAPACRASAISVGNTTLTPGGADAVYVSSNSNATLDLLAPGTDICSAVPTTLDADGWDCGWNGTSMAAPQVTGAIAVLRGYWPGASVNQLERALKESGQSVYDSRNGVTRTRIDVWAGLNRLYQISRGA